MRARILIVEDEPDMANTLAYNLLKAGYEPVLAGTAQEGRDQLARGPFALALLDWMLPDGSGTDLCREIRHSEVHAETPVIMLTARGEEIDRVVGFELGADDYVVKPFSVRELMLRIRAILDRKKPQKTVSESNPHLRLDAAGYRVQADGKWYPIGQRDVAVLRTLIRAGRRVVSRDELLHAAWGEDVQVTTTAVESHMKRLRQRLGPAGRYLQTIRGVGYVLGTPRA